MNWNGQAVTAETTLPEIWIPGDEKFNSYKHSLHEYCQKKHLPATQFKPIKEQNGFLGNVVFAQHDIRCEMVSCNAKKADERAAFEALKKIGYLKSSEFVKNMDKIILKLY